MALGSLNSFKSPFLAIITKPSFPFGSVLCSCGALFGFGNTPSLCLCVTHKWFSLARYFLFRSSLTISSGDKGSKVMRSPLYKRTILLAIGMLPLEPHHTPHDHCTAQWRRKRSQYLLHAAHHNHLTIASCMEKGGAAVLVPIFQLILDLQYYCSCHCQQ